MRPARRIARSPATPRRSRTSTYTWNFGDTGASGTDTWAYGSNKGHNSRNSATGGVAAHLYVTTGVDTAYVATVTAHSGSNTASCQLGVTAYDPAGSNGFAGTKTTCVSASGTPAPGAAAARRARRCSSTSSFNTALGLLALRQRQARAVQVRRYLQRRQCDAERQRRGASGRMAGCEGTQSEPADLQELPAPRSILQHPPPAGDGRIADIDFEGGGSANAAVSTPGGHTHSLSDHPLEPAIPMAITAGYSWAQCAQWGLIEQQSRPRCGAASVRSSTSTRTIPLSGMALTPTSTIRPLIGNLVNGVGAARAAARANEVFRISACRLGCH